MALSNYRAGELAREKVARFAYNAGYAEGHGRAREGKRSWDFALRTIIREHDRMKSRGYFEEIIQSDVRRLNHEAQRARSYGRSTATLERERGQAPSSLDDAIKRSHAQRRKTTPQRSRRDMSDSARQFIDDLSSTSYAAPDYPKVSPTLVKDMSGRASMAEARRVWQRRYGRALHHIDFEAYKQFLRDVDEHILNASRAQVAQYIREERTYFREN